MTDQDPYQKPYQGQPPESQPPEQPYQGQPYQQPYQGQPYQGQPYQGQPQAAQPYYGQPAQYPPPPGYGYPQSSSGTNGLGVAGFVCGLVGLIFFWIPFLGIILALLGVTMGGIGMQQAKRTNSAPGLAIAGLVLGIVALIPAVVVLAAVLSS